MFLVLTFESVTQNGATLFTHMRQNMALDIAETHI